MSFVDTSYLFHFHGHHYHHHHTISQYFLSACVYVRCPVQFNVGHVMWSLCLTGEVTIVTID